MPTICGRIGWASTACPASSSPAATPSPARRSPRSSNGCWTWRRSRRPSTEATIGWRRGCHPRHISGVEPTRGATPMTHVANTPIGDFRISGLPAEPFQPYFAMTDAELHAQGARRVVATEADIGLMPPCRVSLRDAEVGEISILLHYPHHTSATSPYRASGPIFVREGVTQAASVVNQVPAQQRTRLLSVRAYDADGIMVDAEVAPGVVRVQER